MSGCLVDTQSCHVCMAAGDPECSFLNGECSSQPFGLKNYNDCDELTEQGDVWSFSKIQIISFIRILLRFTWIFRKETKINLFKVSFVASGLEELLLLQVPKNNKQGFWLFQISFSKFWYFVTFTEVLSAYSNNNELVYRWSWSETVQFWGWLSLLIIYWKEQAPNPQRNNG